MKINIRKHLFNQMLAVLVTSFTLPASANHLKSFDPKGIDDTIPASKDFYQYVNKGWMEDHPLSAEHASYAQYDLLNDSSSNRVLRIVTELSKANIEKGTTQRLVKQFSTVEVLSGLMANGEYTLGENIADQGGLRIAMTAFLDSQKKKGIDIESDEAIIDGFTPLQTFYLNFANVWANNIREEQIRALTASDVHSLGKNRVNVSLKNIEPFYEAFDIKEGDDMFLPEQERVIIW